VPLHLRHGCRRHQPRELKRFQQLNAVRIQGVIPRECRWIRRSTISSRGREDAASGFTVDYAGESRQPHGGNRFLGFSCSRPVLIFLVLAAQFESFRDPFVILAGSAPLPSPGALLSFLASRP